MNDSLSLEINISQLLSFTLKHGRQALTPPIFCKVGHF